MDDRLHDDDTRRAAPALAPARLLAALAAIPPLSPAMVQGLPDAAAMTAVLQGLPDAARMTAALQGLPDAATVMAAIRALDLTLERLAAQAAGVRHA